MKCLFVCLFILMLITSVFAARIPQVSVVSTTSQPPRSPSAHPSCIDTDGGVDPYVVGELRGIYKSKSGRGRDRCKDELTLIEGYCASDGRTITTSKFECKCGCLEGACVACGNDGIVSTPTKTPPSLEQPKKLECLQDNDCKGKETGFTCKNNEVFKEVAACDALANKCVLSATTQKICPVAAICNAALGDCIASRFAQPPAPSEIPCKTEEDCPGIPAQDSSFFGCRGKTLLQVYELRPKCTAGFCSYKKMPSERFIQTCGWLRWCDSESVSCKWNLW